MAFVLTRRSGPLLRAPFELADAKTRTSVKAELRDHGAAGPVLWFDDGTPGWAIFVAGEMAAERFGAGGGGK